MEYPLQISSASGVELQAGASSVVAAGEDVVATGWYVCSAAGELAVASRARCP